MILTMMQSQKNVLLQYQIIYLQNGTRLKTYLVPLLESLGLCRPPSGSPFHTGHEVAHGCCLLLHRILSDWGIGSWLLLNCFLWAMIRPMTLFPTVETCTTSSLSWRCLIVLVGCWGRKTGCLVALTLVLISSLLVVLTILMLLLRKLPLVLLLLVLTLMMVLVTLLEWLRWVA
jgi:hypothetical protein